MIINFVEDMKKEKRSDFNSLVSKLEKLNGKHKIEKMKRQLLSENLLLLKRYAASDQKLCLMRITLQKGI